MSSATRRQWEDGHLLVDMFGTANFYSFYERPTKTCTERYAEGALAVDCMKAAND
jgi:hypothetical protein